MNANTDPASTGRRRIALVVAIAVVIVLLLALWRVVTEVDDRNKADAIATSSSTSSKGDGEDKKKEKDKEASDGPTTPDKVESPAPKETPVKPVGKKAADPTKSDLIQVQRISGELSPKSVVASKKGQVFAQNMMYTHTMSVFTADGALQKTIDDTVELAEYGIDGHPGKSQGAPVEMAFSPDGNTAWVSNYSMYGANFLPEGADACTSPAGISNSYLYKVDTRTMKIEDVIEVGAVPKYVAATPDGKSVLVSNWCSMDLSVVDVEKGKTVKTIELGGQHPRGIEVTKDSKTAFVAIMGDSRTVEVDLDSGKVSTFAQTGQGPRHLVLSPDGKYLYVTNNNSNTVTKVDAESGEILKDTPVGNQPRSMTISPDGKAIYVVNYNDSTMSKILTKDMQVKETVQTDAHPIGITYEPTKKRVWVACYGGTILVFDDAHQAK